MNIESVFLGLGNTPTARLLALMARLRSPDNGCPWDSVQSFKTIAPYTIEEAYEVSDAIDAGDMGALKEELGDLLFQVIFHAQIADEDGQFDFDGVCDALVRKMIKRHPHVFGDTPTNDPKAVKQSWEQLKSVERAEKATDTQSVLDGIALALPALMRAQKLQKRAARVGFDWHDAAQVIEKITEEAGEITDALEAGEPQERIHEEVGDLIFAVTNLARKLGVDPEHALRDTNSKFTRRFQYIENKSQSGINDMNLGDMEALWVEAKQKGL